MPRLRRTGIGDRVLGSSWFQSEARMSRAFSRYVSVWLGFRYSFLFWRRFRRFRGRGGYHILQNPKLQGFWRYVGLRKELSTIWTYGEPAIIFARGIVAKAFGRASGYGDAVQAI